MAQERQPPEGQTRKIGSALIVVSASNAANANNNGNANNNTASNVNYVAAINLCANRSRSSFSQERTSRT